jgi:arylsulfatase
MGSRTSLTLYPGMIGMMENAFLNAKNRSMTISADVEIPQGGASGVLLAQGGRFGGWSLYLKDGKPTYTYNWIGLERYTVAGSEPLAAGKATIKLDFAYDGGGLGKGGAASLSVNGKKVAEGRIAKTIPYVISTDEGADVGEDDDTPVSEDYVAGLKSRFTGKIDKVTIDVR